MRLHGRADLVAPARAVWEFILDPACLASCIPGLSEVRQVDGQTFEGTVQASVGPMDGSFQFRSVIRRAVFPDDLLVEIHGTDSVTRSGVMMAVTADLVEAGHGTRMQYALQVDVTGRLAILGEMILRATAGAVVSQVTDCIGQRLGEGADRLAGDLSR